MTGGGESVGMRLEREARARSYRVFSWQAVGRSLVFKNKWKPKGCQGIYGLRRSL